MTFAVYGRGSYFAGFEDPSDVDLVVVTDDDLSREEAARRARPYLVDVPAHLPLDVGVVRPDSLSIFARAVIEHGTHVGGDVVDVHPVRPFEWAWEMANALSAELRTRPAEAVLSAIRAVWARDGRVVVPKSGVVRAADGDQWEDLARAAWQHRGPEPFEHPDRDELLREAVWAGAGDAAWDETYERHEWALRRTRSALLTVYRGVLTADEVARVAAMETGRPQTGGRTKTRLAEDDPLVFVLGQVAAIANDYWLWAPRLSGIEGLEMHRYPAGAYLSNHVDRVPKIPTRLLNVVAMIQPAAFGGRLVIEVGGTPPTPELDPGDVVVFDGALLHGVSRVIAGERMTLVTHAHAKRGPDHEERT